MQESSKHIGIIGIGLVGTSLADILLKEHYIVYGYDINPQKLAGFAKKGGICCSTPMEVADKTDQILISLMNSAIVEEVLFGKSGVTNNTHRPLLIIDTSTVEPEKSEEISRHLSELKIDFLESPISGSSLEIKERTAIYLIGGNQDNLQKAQTLFSSLTKKITYVGGVGMAGRAKLAINLIVGINRAALAEGLVFAEKIGISPKKALDLFRNSAAYSHVMDIKGEKMIQEDFSHVQAKLSQHRKDVGLILALAKKINLNLPLSSEHYELLSHAIEMGDGELDNSAIIKEIRRNTIKK